MAAMARRTTTRRKTRRRRKGGVVTIAHTAAFERCEGGACTDPKTDSEKKVWCKQSDDCAKDGCYCQLFRRGKTAKEDEPWLVAPLDHNKEAKHEPDKWDYKCICVRPILEITHTEDGVEYKTRFQLCTGTGDCHLERSMMGDMECTGDCADKKCKCTMFRLPTGGKPEDARWELVAKGGKSVKHEKGYYYRCFCLK